MELGDGYYGVHCTSCTLFSGRTATLIPRKTFTELVAGILGLCIVTESKFYYFVLVCCTWMYGSLCTPSNRYFISPPAWCSDALIMFSLRTRGESILVVTHLGYWET